jgi:hypothetical protein
MPSRLFARKRIFRSSTGTRVSLSRENLRLELEADHLWSLKSRLDIPLDHVAVAFFDPVVAHDRPWSPAPAASLPGSIVLGRASKYGDIVFWDVHDSEQTVVVELRDQWRTWVVISVNDPPALVGAINQAVGAEGSVRPVPGGLKETPSLHPPRKEREYIPSLRRGLNVPLASPVLTRRPNGGAAV